MIYLLQIVIHVLSIVPYYMCVRLYGTMYFCHTSKKRGLRSTFWPPKCFKKFAIFMEKENPCSFFRFSFRATMNFPLMNALVYVDIDQGIHKGKMKVALNEKWKKLHGFSFSINIANFEAFLSVFKLTKNLFFLKSVLLFGTEF